jgi:hypothetical protein
MAQLENPAGGVDGGRKIVTTAATAEQMTTTSVAAVAVSVTAESNNTGLIAVGDSAVVAAAGTQTNLLALLNAGDTVTLNVNSPSLLWLDATVSGDGVAYGYLTP